ncbi:MAG TPA: FtsQ-type POTRA domain-containing protein [Jiangellaceae bacterium]
MSQRPAARQPAGSRKPAGARSPARSKRSATAATPVRRQRSVRRRPPAKVAERRAARSRRRIVRGFLAGLAGLVALSGIGALVWVVGWSEVLALKEVHVSGVDGAVEEEVLAAADAPLGVPLVRVDTAAIAAAVRAVPDVAEVSVSRSWPRALTLSIEQRSPAAAIEDGGSWWRVDESGVLFGSTAEQPADLPVLDAPTGDSAADKAARAAGTAVLTGLPAELSDLVVAVAAESEAAVELTLDGGATVTWGTADQMDRKSEVLLVLLGDEATHYDVSAPTNPAIRP